MKKREIKLLQKQEDKAKRSVVKGRDSEESQGKDLEEEAEDSWGGENNGTTPKQAYQSAS